MRRHIIATCYAFSTLAQPRYPPALDGNDPPSPLHKRFLDHIVSGFGVIALAETEFIE
jgi:hypothetical protein